MNLLFISSNRLGDSLINIQVLNKYIRENPNINITLVSGSLAMPLYDDYNQIIKRISFNKEKFNFHWLKLYTKLFNFHFDETIDFRSSTISFFLKTKKYQIFKMKKKENIYEQIQKKFQTNIEQDMRLIINEERLINTNYNNYACISPFANWYPKEWPIDYFNRCCQDLVEMGIQKIFVLGSLKDSRRFNEILNVNNKIINYCGSSHLLDDYALLKKSKIFIGNDSGMMHLASLANTPSICLFGPTNDNIYFPKLSKNSKLIRSKKSYEELTSNISNLNNYKKNLMNDISYDNVLMEIKKILND